MLKRTYSAVDHFHINISLFGPLVPEVWVIQRDVCSVSRSYKTSLKMDIEIISKSNNICLQSGVLTTLKQKIQTVSCVNCAQGVVYIFLIHLCKCGSSSLRLNSDGLCPSLEYLVNIFFTEFCPFVFLIHDCPICTTLQQILNLLLR